MLIQALCEYYKILSESGEIVSDAYQRLGVHYLIALSEEGKVIGLIENFNEQNEEKSKKAVPREEVVPKRVEIPGIVANTIEHRPLYIFGLNYDKNTDEFSPEDRTDKAKKSHTAFKEINLRFIEGLDSPTINAYRNFLQNFQPTDDYIKDILKPIKKNYETLKFAFCLGDASKILHEDSLIKMRWEEQYSESELGGGVEKGICAISGEAAEIARVHDKIRGFNAMGSVLIGVKESAMSSYGNEQGYNASISQEVMGKYTRALNYLLSERKHKIMLDDITIVHFALNSNPVYDELFNDFFANPNDLNERYTEEAISTLLALAKSGKLTEGDLQFTEKINPNVTFYIIGFKPNSSRIAIKFIHRHSFGEILLNIARHQVDLALSDSSKPISLWQIQKELKSPVSSSANIDPALASKMVQSIINGYEYPKYLLSTVVSRIKTDSDTDKNGYVKINYCRVSIIKACINRSLRLNNKKEEITMGLNPENKTPAYLCGRLFAVLEDLQVDASGGGLNKTIKDTYFASACSKPSLIFPKLLKLANYHIPKATYGSNRSYEMGEIIALMDNEFPDILNLTEQGKFIIGYYQQKYNHLNKQKMEEK